MTMPDFFKNFTINAYYKFIGYLFGLILLFSYFVELKNVELLEVRALSLWMTLGAMGVWLIREMLIYLLACIENIVYDTRKIAVYSLLVGVIAFTFDILIWYSILKYKISLL